MRFQEVVQPGRPGSFFKRDLYFSAESIKQLHNGVGLRLDDTFHDDLAGSIPDRDRNTLLVHIHPDIFNTASHKGRSSSGAVELKHSNLTPQGAPFILRRVTGKVPRAKIKSAVISFALR